MSESLPITVEVTPWRLTWRGGRLGDVSHVEYPGRALETIAVGDWDWATDRHRREPDRGSLLLRLSEWVRDHGDEYGRELPYLG